MNILVLKSLKDVSFAIDYENHLNKGFSLYSEENFLSESF